MSDNKKNEYTEQDTELSTEELSAVSGGSIKSVRKASSAKAVLSNNTADDAADPAEGDKLFDQSIRLR